jgi:hypothetical protein
MASMRSSLLPVVLFPFVLALGACGPKKTTTTVDPMQDARHSPIKEEILPDGLILEKIDLDETGTADIFNYYRKRANAPRLLVRKDTDLNMDGKVDMRSWFDDYGKLQMEEMDLDFDGLWDQKDFYQDTNGDGAVERVTSEIDTDHDERPNVFVVYRDGKVVRKERDTNSDNRIDVWEKFGIEGDVIKAGRDVGPEYDGVVDERYD